VRARTAARSRRHSAPAPPQRARTATWLCTARSHLSSMAWPLAHGQRCLATSAAVFASDLARRRHQATASGLAIAASPIAATHASGCCSAVGAAGDIMPHAPQRDMPAEEAPPWLAARPTMYTGLLPARARPSALPAVLRTPHPDACRGCSGTGRRASAPSRGHRWTWNQSSSAVLLHAQFNNATMVPLAAMARMSAVSTAWHPAVAAFATRMHTNHDASTCQAFGLVAQCVVIVRCHGLLAIRCMQLRAGGANTGVSLPGYAGGLHAATQALHPAWPGRRPPHPAACRHGPALARPHPAPLYN
jgi:hypothetical protein